ncbi:HK97 family phage prohead protease [Streptomyces sp. SID13666]|uniref:HK97 family phage prohead protease n=1 Tax=Streptomyces sp. SID13666 TaxID=2706054 RepID=UPI0013BFC3A2|nr:HK97 family phage prohead protease [Streptomyces sp. SID13666]NEA54446.1 HK97 family phage prohead protease [Streptomyces sp. SID13666]
METRALVRALSARSAGSVLTLRGYGIVFNSPSRPMGFPSFIEQISPAAWKPENDATDVLCTFDHDSKNYLGRRSAGTLRLGADSTGVWFECDLPNTAAGRDIHALVKRGDVAGCSFTFAVEDDEWSQAADGTPFRTVTRMRVVELGPVLNPAYPDTSVAVRSMRGAGIAVSKESDIMSEIYPSGVSGVLTEHADRSRAEVKVFGRAFAETRDADWVDATASGYAPTILSAAGKGSKLIAKVVSFPFARQRGYVPIAPKVTAVIQARNEKATFIENEVTAPDFQAVKITAMVSIDKDVLTDVPPTEIAINTSLAAAIGQRIDHILINGGTDGDVTITGMIADGTSTTVAAIGFDELADAVARIEDSRGEAVAIIGRPSSIAAIRKRVDGSKLGELPELISIPDLADGTIGIPANTVLVADLSAVAVALRKNLEVLKSEREPEAFKRDRVFIAGRARISSVVLADLARVQVLKVGP